MSHFLTALCGLKTIHGYALPTITHKSDFLICNITKDIGDSVFSKTLRSRLKGWKLKSCSMSLSSFYAQYLKSNNNVEIAFWSGNAHASCVLSILFWKRKYNSIYLDWAVVVSCEWASELTSARHHENSRTIPPAASQSILLSKTSAKSASSCQSNQSSNLSCNSCSVPGRGGAVKARLHEAQTAAANTYLPICKKDKTKTILIHVKWML